MENMAANLNVFEVGYMLERVEERIEQPGRRERRKRKYKFSFKLEVPYSSAL
jgi:hypothetical protein